MDKSKSFERYRPDPMYNDDRAVKAEEMADIENWDSPYASNGETLISTAEMAKTIEMMDVLRDEVLNLSGMDKQYALLSGFNKVESEHQIQGTKIISFIGRDKPSYSLQVFEGGREDGKIRVSLVEEDSSEAGLVIQPDGNFQLVLEKKAKEGFYISSFSTRPRDTQIGFTRMTPDATIESVALVNRFLKKGLSLHRPSSPGNN